MAYTHYRAGAERERRIVKRLKAEGFIAVRSAGSHSIIDVWAINPKTRIIRLIQSKMGELSKKEYLRILSEGEALNGDYRVLFELE
jgi:Holliday junction resolvase